MSKNARNHSNDSRNGGQSKHVHNNSRQRSNNFPSFQFVRCDFTSEQKENFIQSVHQDLCTAGQALDLVNEGYKLSVSRDIANDCYIATLSDNREGSPTRYWCLSGRGASVSIALCAVAYKHNVILAEGWNIDNTPLLGDEWRIG